MIDMVSLLENDQYCMHTPHEWDCSLQDTNECVSAPCQNGGTCLDRVNTYECKCVPGFQDYNCQTGTVRCIVIIENNCALSDV